jgi:hypothetical protein
MDSAEILKASGYLCQYRADKWVECLVYGFGEAWLGRGPDSAAALDHALSQMLPSRLATELFVDRLMQSASDAAVEPSESAPMSEPAPEPEPEPRAALPIEVEADSDEPGEFEPARIVALPAMPIRTESAEPTAPPPVVAAPRARKGGVHEQFDALTDEIDAMTGLDFALLAPDLMRLQLLTWAAHARDLADRYPGEDATRRKGGIIQRLMNFGKVYWPGAIAAMRGGATPARAGEEHGFDAEPRDWHEVAEMAEARLSRLQADRDEYGWADKDALPPPPSDPSSRLGEVKATLDKHLADAGRSESSLRARLDALPRAAVTALVGAARIMRWLRCTLDPVSWGETIGRLRRAASVLQDAGLSEALNPAFCPPKSWFISLRPAAGRGRPRVLGPPAGAGADMIVAWLRSDGDALDLAALRVALRQHLDLVRALDLTAVLAGGEFGGLRRRLGRLLKGEGAAPPDGDADARHIEAALPEVAAAPETPAPTMIDRARALVAGRRALFVGNRIDTELMDRLAAELELTPEGCVVGQKRQVQNAAERIRRGSYDLVLLATGFVDHSAEAIIRDAVRARGVTSLRVGKGRILACAVAIVRGVASV